MSCKPCKLVIKRVMNKDAGTTLKGCLKKSENILGYQGDVVEDGVCSISWDDGGEGIPGYCGDYIMYKPRDPDHLPQFNLTATWEKCLPNASPTPDEKERCNQFLGIFDTTTTSAKVGNDIPLSDLESLQYCTQYSKTMDQPVYGLAGGPIVCESWAHVIPMETYP